VGLIMPGVRVAVASLDADTPARADSIGEILVARITTASAFWGLDGLSQGMFGIRLENTSTPGSAAVPFVRTGLIGFVVAEVCTFC
jgi:hypothetical protein